MQTPRRLRSDQIKKLVQWRNDTPVQYIRGSLFAPMPKTVHAVGFNNLLPARYTLSFARRLARSLVLLLSFPTLFAAANAFAEHDTAKTASVLAKYRFFRAAERTRLPKGLREISGLVALANKKVALHTDNSALVWSFDYGASRLGTRLLVSQAIPGDFEGIALHKNYLLLSDSHGSISRFVAGLPEEKTEPKRELYHPAFKERCVFEGLAVIPPAPKLDANSAAAATLLLPCKYPRFTEAGEPAADDSLIYIFRQSMTATHTPDVEAGYDVLKIDVSSVLRARRLPRLRPSAIELVDGRLLILAGKERVLLETTLAGELIDWQRLAWPRHRQAEGLTIGSDGALIIADEGRWLGGTVTVYQPKTERTAK